MRENQIFGPPHPQKWVMPFFVETLIPLNWYERSKFKHCSFYYWFSFSYERDQISYFAESFELNQLLYCKAAPELFSCCKRYARQNRLWARLQSILTHSFIRVRSVYWMFETAHKKIMENRNEGMLLHVDNHCYKVN